MISTPLTERFVHGAIELEAVPRGVRPHRLPRRARERDADAQLLLMEAQPSGVRISFLTRARRVELDVHATRVAYRGLPRPRGAIDALVDGTVAASQELTGGDAIELDLATGGRDLIPGLLDTVALELPDGPSLVELLLPHNEAVDLVALRSDAPLDPAPLTGPVWLHHGSSISQGSNAARPSGIWPAVAARASGARLVNLGFGGSALADPFTARLMRDTPADLISVALGINLVNLDGMRRRTLGPAVPGFLDTIREGHPATPLLLITPVFCGIHEDTPGPGTVDPASFATGASRFTATGEPGDTATGRLTLRVVREVLAEVVAARSDDPLLRLLDGLALYGAEDAERLPLPDGLHPDAETHELIGRRFAELVFGQGGAFAAQG
ncbi:lipase [Rathayibacter sp. AY1B1]|uniref:GDSL-type esterase/lipase family protein n=1 Tax=unclassified Rathayibacter TaxID=2609250 RepID=UPI000CE8057A|nr:MULTISPECIES: GDSL-type esterase/lipase family protein [unclassified Rathayibacter]PPI21177.1 lipase [Rathayibacter sp. AY1B6]PPI35069.1 lipase [Rathayibacter sp. AY1B1]